MMIYPLKEINSIKTELIKNRQTLSIAESVTGGQLQATFSLADDARDFFQGGVTAYNLGQKVKLLDIEPIHALQCDCVSRQVAEEMAVGVSKLFNSSYGIGITGYAATVPEKHINRLFAHFAISENAVIICSRTIESPEMRAVDVQLRYVAELVKAFSNLLVQVEDEFNL